MGPAWDYLRFTICAEPSGSNALHQTLDRVLDGDNADQFSLRVDDGGEAEASGAQTLNDSIRRLGVPRDHDAAHVTAQGFAARFVEKDVERIYQTDRFASIGNDGQAIDAVGGAQLQCF